MHRKLAMLMTVLLAFAAAGCSAVIATELEELEKNVLRSEAAAAAEPAEDEQASGSKAAESEPEAMPVLDLERLELVEGDRYLLSECILAEFGQLEDIVFESYDETIAFVDTNGELLARAPGETVVNAVCGDARSSLTVAVSEVPEAPGVHLEQPYLKLAPGAAESLICSITGGLTGEPIWSSSNEAVAVVDGAGHVTAGQNGTARITVQISSYNDSVLVWVTDQMPFEPLSETAPPRYAEEDGVLKNAAAADTGTAAIMLTGDLMALSAQQNAARSGGTYNYNSSFGLVAPIFAQADFVMGNLETCLAYSKPYTVQEKSVQGNPNCNVQATFLDALRFAGYDAVATANNHCGDAGMIGICETAEMLDTYQIAHTGTFTQSGGRRFFLADINGIRTAFLSYTELINTKYGDLEVPEPELPIVFNRYTREKLQADIAAAREAGAEFIIAYTHWGCENTHAYTEDQMAHAQEMADAGVDFIAGSHSHCLQPAAMITAADGRQVPCIFSMGNFVSSMAKDINNDTVILKLDLAREGDSVVLQRAGYIPCRVYPEYEGGHHVIVPAAPALNGGRSSSSLDAARARITGVVGTDVFEEIQVL